MKAGRSLIDLERELARRLTTMQDMIVPTHLMTHETNADGVSRVVIESDKGPLRYETQDVFRHQLADKLQIPWTYFERMQTEQPALLDRNVNTWLQAKPERRLVRTLDGYSRAFLSDRYRRIDNYDVLQKIFPILRGIPNARFESAEVTDRRLYIKVVAPNVSAEIDKGDIVNAGVVISNSEIGEGSLTVKPLVYRLACKNGLIRPDSGMRRVHLGRATESSPDEVTFYKEDTLAADDAAFLLKLRDVVEDAVTQASFELAADKMRRTLGIPLRGDPAKVVKALGVKFLLNESERSGVLRTLVTEAQLSAYGLINAVTGFAQELESYDRSTELEAQAGLMLEQSASEWAAILDAA